MADRNQFYNDPESALRIAMDYQQSSMWTAIPAIVDSVDFTTMTISAQPAIQGQLTDLNGLVSYVNLPLLIHVPIQFPVAGGFALTLPIKANDEVLVIFASRCIDSWWQSGGVGVPLEFRMHDLSDGFAIVGIRSLPNVIPSISSTTAQLRNLAGTSYIELDGTGKINLVAPAGITMTGPVNITGAVEVTGEVTAGTIPLSAHLHSGVTSGPSDTGPAIP